VFRLLKNWIILCPCCSFCPLFHGTLGSARLKGEFEPITAREKPVILKLTVITYFSFVLTDFMSWCNGELNESLFCMCGKTLM
jgi:hypothetical protein